MMKKILKKYISKLPAVSRLLAERTYYPPGHFYSPIPSQAGIELADRLKGNPVQDVAMNDSAQLALFETLAPYIENNPFNNEEKQADSLFYNRNGFYGYGDAQTLQAMVRHLKPKNIIEVGSGFSSALLYELNRTFFEGKIKLQLIEPYPARLQQTFREVPNALEGMLLEKKLEEIDLNLFRQLKSGDILFIDSSHVLKAGSDLYVLFFTILPILAPGVYIHFHDIFFGFEYLDHHYSSKKGFAWNESYFLRAFLMNNREYEIVLFLNHLDTVYPKQLLEYAPSYQLQKGGACWIRKSGA